MTHNYQEFSRRVRSNGTTIKQFCELFGLNYRGLTNRAEIGVSKELAAISVLIQLLAENGIEWQDRIRAMSMEKRAPRGRNIGLRKKEQR